VLVIQRTLQHGAALGLATGLGAAVADAAYGAVGAFGVAVLIGWLQALRLPLVIGGSALLIGMAWRTWRSGNAPGAPAPLPAVAAPRGLVAAFAGTLLLTLSNPATILSFVAVFGAMASAGAAAPAWQVAGVGLGSALWWLGLVAGVAALRDRIGPGARRRIAWLSALMLLAFALWQLAQLWRLPVA
jgi:threonine/homoserine/homoserine lactone efflux protein